MSGFWDPMATVATQEITTSMPVRAGVREATEVKSTRLMVRLGCVGRLVVEVELWRVRIVMVWFADRRAERMEGPRLPVAPARAMVVGIVGGG